MASDHALMTLGEPVYEDGRFKQTFTVRMPGGGPIPTEGISAASERAYGFFQMSLAQKGYRPGEYEAEPRGSIKEGDKRLTVAFITYEVRAIAPPKRALLIQ